MGVTIGSARSDERGKINSGKAGDQTGREVSTQAWYRHSKGWRVLRCIHEDMRAFIAEAMRAACNNSKIGYDQWQRLTLLKLAEKVGYNPAMVTAACETDCSALVRVCILYALAKTGRGGTVGNFTTGNQASTLIASGLFVELDDSKYTGKSDYLCAGDVLVTKTKGHTVVVLNDGPKAEKTPVFDVTALGDRILRNGAEGADVREMQSMLLQLGYDLGKWGADGDFGDATEQALMEFQREHRCAVDGEFGPETLAALMAAMNEGGDGEEEAANHVRIVGGQCWARTKPNTSGDKLGICKSGTQWPFAGEKSGDGWLKISFNGQAAWVSGKYGKLVY